MLHVAQHRLREKSFLADHGFPVTPFAPIRSRPIWTPRLAALGAPAVLKTAGFGYDGKGQVTIAALDDQAAPRLGRHGPPEAVLEAFVAFEREVSVVVARGLDGAFAHFGVVENTHANHILDSRSRRRRSRRRSQRRPSEIARGVARGARTSSACSASSSS